MNANEEWPWGLHPANLDLQIRNWKPFRVSSASPSAWDQDRLHDLPYLCDREEQVKDLQLKVPAQRNKYPRRPLVLLVQGEYQQVFDRFVDRLRDSILPDILRRELVQRKGPVEFRYASSASFPDPLDPMRRELAARLGSGAGFKDIVEAVAACHSPVLIDVIVPLEGNGRILDSIPLLEWLTELAGWPDLPEGQYLMFLLRFGYYKKSPELPVDDLLQQVEVLAPKGLSVIKLEPPLGNVFEWQVRAWIEKYFGPPSRVSDCLNKKARQMFLAAPVLPTEDAPSLPMEEAADKLHDHLKECVQPARRSVE